MTDTQTGESYEQSGLEWEIAGDTVTFTASMAGVYTITVTLTDRNYAWGSGSSTPDGDTITFVWTVNKIAAEPTVTIEGWAYGEAPNAPRVVLEGDEGVTYTPKYMGTPNDGSGYTDFGQTPPTLAGEYTVMVEVDASRNYTAAVRPPMPSPFRAQPFRRPRWAVRRIRAARSRQRCRRTPGTRWRQTKAALP